MCIRDSNKGKRLGSEALRIYSRSGTCLLYTSQTEASHRTPRIILKYTENRKARMKMRRAAKRNVRQSLHIWKARRCCWKTIRILRTLKKSDASLRSRDISSRSAARSAQKAGGRKRLRPAAHRNTQQRTDIRRSLIHI